MQNREIGFIELPKYLSNERICLSSRRQKKKPGSDYFGLKKSMKTKTLITLAAAIIIFAACNENEDESPSNGTADATIGEAEIAASDSVDFKALIDGGSSKVWMASAFTLAGSTTFTSCRLDDEMTLNSDGTYMYNGGINLCGAEDNQQIKLGTWALDFSEKMLLFDAGTQDEADALVIGLTENEIRLRGAYMSMEVRGVYTAGE